MLGRIWKRTGVVAFKSLDPVRYRDVIEILEARERLNGESAAKYWDKCFRDFKNTDDYSFASRSELSDITSRMIVKAYLNTVMGESVRLRHQNEG